MRQQVVIIDARGQPATLAGLAEIRAEVLRELNQTLRGGRLPTLPSDNVNILTYPTDRHRGSGDAVVDGPSGSDHAARMSSSRPWTCRGRRA